MNSESGQRRRIAILGYGAYGRAIGSLLQHNNQAFTPADIERPLIGSVDILFLAVPTQHIRNALAANAACIRSDTAVINTGKGIETSSQKFPYEIVQELGYINYYNIIGPSFADGIVNKDPTLVSLGFLSGRHIEVIKQVLQTPHFRIRPTSSYQALEVSAALKNVYAIICGYADGLGLGANTRAKLITHALQETASLCSALGLPIDVLDSGVVGDMVLTCTSTGSRNYSFGHALANRSLAEALALAGSTVEGYHTSRSIAGIAAAHNIELPLADLTAKLIDAGRQGRGVFTATIATL